MCARTRRRTSSLATARACLDLRCPTCESEREHCYAQPARRRTLLTTSPPSRSSARRCTPPPLPPLPHTLIRSRTMAKPTTPPPTPSKPWLKLILTLLVLAALVYVARLVVLGIQEAMQCVTLGHLSTIGTEWLMRERARRSTKQALEKQGVSVSKDGCVPLLPSQYLE